MINNISRYKNTIIVVQLLVVLGILSACSTNANDSDYVYQRSQSHRPQHLPQIPEIPAARMPQPAPRYTPPPVAPAKPKVPKVTVKPYKPEVHKYSPNKVEDTVITQKEVAAVTVTDEEQAKKREEEIKQKYVVDTDPYANIPDDSSSEQAKHKSSRTASAPTPVLSRVKPVKPSARKPVPKQTSSAVKALLVKARADLAIGRTSSAIDELERGLRIEPENPDLWYQLARANYAKKNYTQAISMAKKSISNTNRDYIIAKNWMLIKKAGLKSGDTVVVKEAIDYFKINP